MPLPATGRQQQGVRQGVDIIRDFQQRNSFQIRQTLLGSSGIAIRTFVDNKSGNEKVKVVAVTIPPAASRLLIGCDWEYLADSPPQASDCSVVLFGHANLRDFPIAQGDKVTAVFGIPLDAVGDLDCV